ncbi:MAG: 16S rRNA (guanine(966)-N(2))-methyltransferase RsmD [Clostridia bacterium]|nr:16S rRNA (guanine(966)-N(2))-methyltransferase RsmD [Clostridia bacterium]
MMRIITGSAKGIPLATLPGETTRPTAERVKEAVFSMIQFEVEGMTVLDLFAGSGQMALEALSRGARRATLCDSSREAISIIQKNAEKTKLAPLCEIRNIDALTFLKTAPKEKYDLVFLDPPYRLSAIPVALRLLLSGGLLRQTARIFCESASFEDVFAGDENLAGRFDCLRQNRYGAAHITLLTPKGECLS